MRSAVCPEIERKSNSQCAASRQPLGLSPSRNGASELPSRWPGTLPPSRSSAVGRMSTASVNASTVPAGCLSPARVADDQRDVVAAVEEAAFAEHEMVAHHLGMVGGEDDDRVVPGAVRLDAREDAAELRVDLRDHAVIERADAAEGGLVPVGHLALLAGHEILPLLGVEFLAPT